MDDGSEIEDLLALTYPKKVAGAYDKKIPNRTDNDKKSKPCFSTFHGTCTLGNACEWSHDAAVLAKYGKDELARLNASPYMRNALNVMSPADT